MRSPCWGYFFPRQFLKSLSTALLRYWGRPLTEPAQLSLVCFTVFILLVMVGRQQLVVSFSRSPPPHTHTHTRTNIPPHTHTHTRASILFRYRRVVLDSRLTRLGELDTRVTFQCRRRFRARSPFRFPRHDP